MKTCVGQIALSSKQAQRLELRKGTRISPHLRKCCLILVGNESFINAERDLEVLTGIRVAHSTQHRLVNQHQFPEPEIIHKADTISVDGGSVRIRTSQGKPSEWKNYKALKIHSRKGVAYFQDNEALLQWVNQQPLSNTINCLGDGHDGVWNIIEKISPTHNKREILDWYHLMENLHKVGGSNQRLKKVRKLLWYGFVDDAIAQFEKLSKKQAKNFQNYLRKHCSRIPDYQMYQQLEICIGSGSVESWIKQIASRIKITGAQWNSKNVPQILKLRCAYLNGDII